MDQIASHSSWTPESDDGLRAAELAEELLGVSSSGGKTAKGDSDKAQARRMSNKELRSRVNRLRLEKEFATLSKETRPGTKPVQIDKAVKALGTVAAVTGSALTIYKNVNKAMEIASKVK